MLSEEEWIAIECEKYNLKVQQIYFCNQCSEAYISIECPKCGSVDIHAQFFSYGWGCECNTCGNEFNEGDLPDDNLIKRTGREYLAITDKGLIKVSIIGPLIEHTIVGKQISIYLPSLFPYADLRNVKTISKHNLKGGEIELALLKDKSDKVVYEVLFPKDQIDHRIVQLEYIIRGLQDKWKELPEKGEKQAAINIENIGTLVIAPDSVIYRSFIKKEEDK